MKLYHGIVLLLCLVRPIVYSTLTDEHNYPTNWGAICIDAEFARDSFLQEAMKVNAKGLNLHDVQHFIRLLNILRASLDALSDIKRGFQIVAFINDTNIDRLRKMVQDTGSFYANISRATGFKPRMTSYTRIVDGFFQVLLHECSGGFRYIFAQNVFYTHTHKNCENNKLNASNTMLPPSITSVCRSAKTCDLPKALPKFAVYIWARIGYSTSNFSCFYTHLPEYKSILHDIALVQAYLYTWDGMMPHAFYNGTPGTFGHLDKAMQYVENSDIFNYTSLACFELKDDEMCALCSIRQQYVMLRKIEKGSIAWQTRDIGANLLNKQTMMKNQLKAKQHLEVLRGIEELDKNLKALAVGLSDYFESLATFDTAIANEDVEGLKSDINKASEKSDELTGKLSHDMSHLLDKAVATLTIEIVADYAKLSLTIAQNMNPFKLVLGDVDGVAIIDAAEKLAEDMSKFDTLNAIRDALTTLSKNSRSLCDGFDENRKQLGSLGNIVKSFLEGQDGDMEKYENEFIDQYGSYTPEVDPSKLEANNALWSAYKQKACDLLFSLEQGATVMTGIKLICENMEATLAEFFAVRENMYNFQDDMIDALVRVVRGNIAKRLSSAIDITDGKEKDYLHAKELFMGFFLMSYNTQQNAYDYCNILQYKRHGKRPDICPTSGFIGEEDLDKLVAFDDLFQYTEQDQVVYIPTRPAFLGDYSFIDLPSLVLGKPVSFSIPENRTWLAQNNWVLPNDKIIAPFVKSFKVFLPLKNYALNGADVITVVTVSSAGYSKASLELKTNYLIPESSGHFRHVYEEGYTSCRTRIVNPYSLCNNLPKICERSEDSPSEGSISPTILSTWTLSYNKSSGARNVEWDAPTPISPFFLKASIRIAYLSSMQSPRAQSAQQADHCCHEGNKYYLRWNGCVPCPDNSTSSLGGYYCENNTLPADTGPSIREEL